MLGERTPGNESQDERRGLPFDAERLDDLLTNAGLDALLVSSRHNLRYLLGGYANYFYGVEPSLGISRYEPLVLYVAGRPEAALYLGNWTEPDAFSTFPIWIAERVYGPTDIRQNALALADALHDRDLARGRIGIEADFVSATTVDVLREALPELELRDALRPLEELRSIKSDHELRLIRRASEDVVESMLTVFRSCSAGTSSAELAAALADEERARGLDFDYAHIAIGGNLNRVPSPSNRLRAGQTLSLDSGGNARGYIGDLARMGFLGEPTADHLLALDELEHVQRAACAAIRPGATGRDVYREAEAVRVGGRWADRTEFMAHGMGLITHEYPRIAPLVTNAHGYEPEHEQLPLRAGMVLSVESILPDATLGYIKLEDTVAVTADGSELLGGGGRGWNVIGGSGG